MQTELQVTRDGSHTLYSRQFDQLYHNPNGAISESLHVFFEPSRIKSILKQETSLNILEVGFGTGLNLLLLLDMWLKSSRKTKVVFQSIEAYPISSETAKSLNYLEELGNPGLKEVLPKIFEALSPGQNIISFYPNFEVRIFYSLFDDFSAEDFQADSIFFDAFSPEVNPQLWSDKVFEIIAHYSKSNALLTTYCAASKARAAMASAGWYVARAPGALGKREMTVASLNVKKLFGYKRVNEKKLAERYRAGDF